MKRLEIIILIPFFILIFFGLYHVNKVCKAKPKPKTIQELNLSENTILFTVNLNNATCYIAESKTNGYVDVEIDCK